MVAKSSVNTERRFSAGLTSWPCRGNSDLRGLSFSSVFLYGEDMNPPMTRTIPRFAPRLLITVFFGFLSAVQIMGCSGSATTDTVRPDVAKDTLVAALTAWKSGMEVPDLLKAQTPAIVVQDMDWSAGAKLQDFELQGDGKSVGANLSIEVQLTLVDAAGQTTLQKVWYLVGTDPALTVFRDMFH